VEFVAAGHLFRASVREIRKTAAWIDAADHLGAFIGALTTGILLLPALGFGATLLAFAALKGLGALVCLYPGEVISRRRGS
jgi:predicted membrane-bound spermidine synthase